MGKHYVKNAFGQHEFQGWTCDHCRKPIETTVVDGKRPSDFLSVDTYGLAFHMDCLLTMSGAEMLGHMTDESSLNGDWDLRLRSPQDLVKTKGSRAGLRFG